MAIDKTLDVGLSDLENDMEAAAPVAEEAPRPARKKSSNPVDQIVSDNEVAQFKGDVEPGSMSSAIAFVESLGDPSTIDTYSLKVGDKVEKRTASKIVGYRFRAMQDIEVPDFGTTPEFSANRLMSAEDVTRWKQVAAGEEFDLTRLETAALLTRPEYNFVASGGEHEVNLALSFRTIDTSKPVEKVSDLPDAQLQLRGGSIKDLAIRDVLKYESNTTEGNRFARGTREMLPEFVGTKWENLAKEATRSARRGGGVAKTNAERKSNDRLAQGAAFQKLMAGLAK